MIHIENLGVNIVGHFALLTAVVLLTSPVRASEILTKENAFKILKEKGFRWQQTNLLPLEAQALVGQAQAALKPHIGIYSREYVGRVNQIQFGFDTPGPITFFTVGSTALQFDYPLIDQFSATRVTTALENKKMNDDQALQYQTDLTYLMIIQYLNTQRLKKKLETVESSLKRDADIYRIAQIRIKSNTGLAVDLMRAKGLTALDNLKKIDTETSLKKSRMDLAGLLGVEDKNFDLEPFVYREFNLPSQEAVGSESLEARPDLKTAKSTLTLALANKTQMQKEDTSKLQFYGEMGVLGTHVIGGVGNAVNGSVGFQLSIPLSSGGYYPAREQEAEVKVMKAELNLKQMQLDVASQVELAREQLKNSKLAVETSKSFVDTAEEELRLILKKANAGVSSGLELSNSHANLATAMDGSIDAIFGYEISKLNYFKSVGKIRDYFEFERGTK